MKYIRQMLLLLLSLSMLVLPVQAARSWDAEAQRNLTSAGLRSLNGKPGNLLRQNEDFPAGTSACDWTAMALALSGSEEDFAAYLDALQSYVQNAYTADGGLDRVKATPYHRIALTVLALGGDPTAFGTKSDGSPINLIADGTYSFHGDIGAQGLNGWIYALLALDASGVEVPADAKFPRQAMIDAIVSAQEPEGGFGLISGGADVDITAMALQALAPYAQAYPDTVEAALNYLASQMTDNGTFRSYGDESAESSAQVLLTLSALGIDPEEDPRFVRGVETVLTGIARFQQADGTYSHLRNDTQGDFLATAQMLLAVTALQKMRSGSGWIFDFASYEGPVQLQRFPWQVAAAIAAAAAVMICIVIMRKRRNHGKNNG